MPKIIENLKDRIIEESRNLLLEKSYKDLNIREIAKKCEIGTGTFYNYFSNKENLVTEIFRNDWKKISIMIEKLKSSHEPVREKFRKIYLYFEQFISDYISIFYEIVVSSNYNNSCKEVNKFDIIYTKVSELIEIEKNQGNIKSTLSSYKLAQFIISNIIYLNKNKYISFDELYDSFNI